MKETLYFITFIVIDIHKGYIVHLIRMVFAF